MAPSKVYAFKEIATHNRNKDCWLIISGTVYDVSMFMEDHPGGSEALLMSAGKDATTDFEEVGHSESAIDMMEKYVIGQADLKTVPTKRIYLASGSPGLEGLEDILYKKPGFPTKIWRLLVTLLILGLALAFRTNTKKE